MIGVPIQCHTTDLQRERKDKKSIVNETVESIRKLINDYEIRGHGGLKRN